MSKITYIVSFKDEATPEQIAEAKKQAVAQKGTIGEEFSTTMKGFEVTYPEGTVTTLKVGEELNIDGVEFSGEVHTQ